MSERFKFDRMELAVSLGDLGTLLPIATAMVPFNGLNPTGLFLSIGAFYVLSGCYFGITVPVQPMKVIGAYAIATAMSASQILASSLLMGVFLMIPVAKGLLCRHIDLGDHSGIQPGGRFYRGHDCRPSSQVGEAISVMDTSTGCIGKLYPRVTPWLYKSDERNRCSDEHCNF